MTSLENIISKHYFWVIPARRKIQEFRFTAPHLTIKRRKKEVRICHVTHDKEVYPHIYVLGLGIKQEFGLAPRGWVRDVLGPRIDRLQRGLSCTIVDLVDQIPFFIWREVEDLRRPEITFGELEHKPLYVIRLSKISK